jgi:phage replication O-like protein O
MLVAEQPIASYNGNPQLEDGHTRIANELLEAIIKFKFTERQYKVFFAILRKTYGFNKTNDDISLSQISVICDLPVNHVSTVINQLVKLNIIIKKQGVYAQNLMINKIYDTWGLHNMECHNVELPNVDKGVTSLGVIPFPTMEPQNTTSKDNTKEICIELLEYFNEKANKRFEPVKANLDFIKGRLKEFKREDVIRVIDVKVAEWINDPFMKKYLRPATIFNATKFAQYAAEGYEEKQPDWMRGAI